MRLLGRNHLHSLQGQDPETDQWLRNWTSEIAYANWKAAEEISKQYPTVVSDNENNFFFRIATKKMRIKVVVCFNLGIAMISGATHV